MKINLQKSRVPTLVHLSKKEEKETQSCTFIVDI